MYSRREKDSRREKCSRANFRSVLDIFSNYFHFCKILLILNRNNKITSFWKFKYLLHILNMYKFCCCFLLLGDGK